MKKVFLIIGLLSALAANAEVKNYEGGYIDLAWGNACKSPSGNIMTDLTKIQGEKVFIKLYRGNGGYSTSIHLINPGEVVTTESQVYGCQRLAKCANALSSREISVSAQCIDGGNNLRVRFIPNI
jgi:hypothetical protein